jgi:succinyl-CoA synthetase beta subunit
MSILVDSSTRVAVQGITDAHKQMKVGVPVVARLAGTKLEEGVRLLNESRLAVERAEDLGDAARKAVAAARR